MCDQIFHPADFWIHHLPEISLPPPPIPKDNKNCFFSVQGDLSPFDFVDHDIIQKTFFPLNRQSESLSVLVKIIYMHSATHFNTFSAKSKSQDRIVKFVKILKNNMLHFFSWTLILPRHTKSINHKKNDKIGIYLEFYFHKKLKF